MYRISNISVGNMQYKCVSFPSINAFNSCRLICEDENGTTKVVAFKGKWNKKALLNLMKTYGIYEITGVGSKYLFVFDDLDLKLLDLLDWEGRFDSSYIDFPDSELLIEAVDDINHMTYSTGAFCLTLTDVLLHMLKNYKVVDDKLIIKTSTNNSPTYKILDTKKFNNLLTKMIVLRSKNV